ncbi:MAG: hypothetical protein RL208_618 [Pseudomonadota bacterium]|jgi:hypothetical protein
MNRIKNIIRANSLAKDNEQFAKANEYLRKKISEMSVNIIEDGIYLMEQPFIPEYLGFQETVLEQDDILLARIYTRNGYNLARPVNGTDRNWFLLYPDGKRVEVKIDNMYNGIIILDALGLDYQIDKYRNGEYSLENL